MVLNVFVILRWKTLDAFDRIRENGEMFSVDRIITSKVVVL